LGEKNSITGEGKVIGNIKKESKMLRTSLTLQEVVIRSSGFNGEDTTQVFESVSKLLIGVFLYF
jgi:hypothetical protein